MPRHIVKLGEFYLMWSTVVDAPITFGMPLDEFQAYYQDEYGREGMRGLPERLGRVKRTGTSSHLHRTPDELMVVNRAGPGGCELTLDEIYKAYCLRQPVRGDWLVPVCDD